MLVIKISFLIISLNRVMLDAGCLWFLKDYLGGDFRANEMLQKEFKLYNKQPHDYFLFIKSEVQKLNEEQIYTTFFLVKTIFLNALHNCEHPGFKTLIKKEFNSCINQLCETNANKFYI